MPSKTFAMRVYAVTYWLLALLFVYIFVVLILPLVATQPEVGAFIPIVLVFLALFVLGAGLTTFLASAPRRRWLWIVLVIPPLLFLLINLPFVPFALTHPSDVAFTAITPLVVGTAVLIAVGVIAFLEVRDQRPRMGGVRSRVALALMAGGLAGAFATGVLAAGASGSDGSTLAATPTTSATLVAQATKYLPTSYSIGSGDVLGLFVENKDGFAHAFDIDSLAIHVQIPANSTVAIAIAPTGTGKLDFYCSIPGHKEAGMAGSIDVHEAAIASPGRAAS